MNDMPSFSERHNYQAAEKPIRYREDASTNVRTMVIKLAEKHGLLPSTIRSIICAELMTAPDASNWSEYPNIDTECRILLGRCEWFEVYDIIEELRAAIHNNGAGLEKAYAFQADINNLLVRDGAGWQMISGVILARGSEPFNNIVETARSVLSPQNPTATSEIHEAIRDISRRPHPDKTGAVHHAMGAVECVARSLTGEKGTLGEIVKGKAKQLGIPAPLDEAISKMWGYASERGRHIREGYEPSFEEAELVVTVAAAVCLYLTRKAP